VDKKEFYFNQISNLYVFSMNNCTCNYKCAISDHFSNTNFHCSFLENSYFEIQEFIAHFQANLVPNGFNYNSGDNTEWETIEGLREDTGS
jgi:hypothetical protein